jgi:hypothetical protein
MNIHEGVFFYRATYQIKAKNKHIIMQVIVLKKTEYVSLLINTKTIFPKISTPLITKSYKLTLGYAESIIVQEEY